jgi:ParB-like chromosome segregation protein Spo0J
MMMDYIAEELRGLAVPIGSITEDPDNLRKHDKRSISSVQNSLERFGQRTPIVARNGIVIAGNARLVAAINLGWSHIAVVSADSDDDTTAKLYAITDNRTADLSEFDMAGLAGVLSSLKDEDIDLDSLGWSDEELGELLDLELPGENEQEEAPIPEPPVEPTTKPGDLILFGAYLECDACGKRQDYDPARVGEQCCDG